MNKTPRNESLDHDAINEVLRAVTDDVHAAEQVLAVGNTPHNRRSYVRAAFAAIEAVIFWIKYREVRIFDRGLGRRYKAEELSILREESYALDQSGRVYTQQRFIPLDQNVRFVIRTVFDASDVAKHVDFGAGDWAVFRQALDVRNRVAHPKRSHDLDVSEQDLIAVRHGHNWVWATALRLYFEQVQRLQDTAAELRAKVEAASANSVKAIDLPTNTGGHHDE